VAVWHRLRPEQAQRATIRVIGEISVGPAPLLQVMPDGEIRQVK
jgi:hypothetical protein